VLSSFPSLKSLDLGGNPCMEDPSRRYVLIRTVPALAELDGDSLRPMDRQLADEFFTRAAELGFQERPTTARQRPGTAPAAAVRAASSRQRVALASDMPWEQANERGGQRGMSPARLAVPSNRCSSRVPSASPDGDAPHPADNITDPAELAVAIQKYTAHVEALHLRLRTTQVDCENLQRQIAELRDPTPQLGAARVRDQVARLEAENQGMHELVVENQRLRQRLEGREVELARRRQKLGLPGQAAVASLPGPARPGSGSRPRTAAEVAETVLQLSASLGRAVPPGTPTAGVSLPEARARNVALRRDIDRVQEEIAQLRLGACSALLGRQISPTPGERLHGESQTGGVGT